MIIKNIGRLVTMEPLDGAEGPLGIIENASIEIEDGKIRQIICHPEGVERPNDLMNTMRTGDPSLPSVAQDDMQTIDANGRVVIPGLIDCHTHLVHAGSRADEFAARARGATYEEIARAGGGIMSTVRATRKASEDELFELAAGRAKESLAHGVTTIEVKSGYGLDLKTELKMLRVIKRLNKELPQDFVPTFLAHVFPILCKPACPAGRLTKGRSGYINLIIAKMLPAVAKEDLAKFCDVFVEKIAFTKKEAKDIFEAAEKYGLKAKIHADQLSSCGGAKLAAELKAISADHLEHISDADISALAGTSHPARPLSPEGRGTGVRGGGVVAVLIPSSTFFLGGKYAPARELIKAGVKVAVATDYNPGTSPILNLWLAAAMAITQMKMTPEETYKAITINAARALGMEKTHGSIKEGKFADLVLLDTKDEFKPFYRPDKSFVGKVIKTGRVILE